jgi:hypothetical protein
MSVIRKWLTGRPSMPDLGDTREGAQHGLVVRLDGKPYELVHAEHFPGTEHSQVKLTFIPGRSPR